MRRALKFTRYLAASTPGVVVISTELAELGPLGNFCLRLAAAQEDDDRLGLLSRFCLYALVVTPRGGDESGPPKMEVLLTILLITARNDGNQVGPQISIYSFVMLTLVQWVINRIPRIQYNC